MSTIRAVVVDPEVAGRLAIKEVEAPQPNSSQAIIQVDAISLNRGDVMGAMHFGAGWRPGWDLAGTVIQQAADGTGPKVGSRVVGSLSAQGAWAEQVAVATTHLAELPDSVSFAQAATLPIAGLTALHAVEKGGYLLNKRVLITGSTGGVGLFAHQFARLSGAYVVGMARQASHEALVREAGADEVIVGEDLAPASAYGPYDLIIESLGGKALESALTLLKRGGSCVTLGWSATPSASANINLMRFIQTGGTTLCAVDWKDSAEDLARLAQMVAKQKLRTFIEVETSWKELGEVAQRFVQRQFTGKAVLHLD
jgi:NADPH:quinone reductase-like Zn-dependent oxidoreductase